MIAILVPTRNLIFTETANVVSDIIREDGGSKAYYSVGLRIPHAHNQLAEEAFKDGASHFLFLEEDVVPPKGFWRKLLFATEDISFIDYSVNGYSCAAKDEKGKILWAGLGCTMIKRCVFERLEYPWFRTDKSLRLNDMKWIDVPPEKQYGQQDIWFFRQAIENGCTIKQIEGECRHLYVEKLGDKGTNDGVHEVKEREKISKYQVINL